MGGVGPGSAREEAERLVATVLGAVRLAATEARSGTSWGPIGEALSGVLNHTSAPASGKSGDSPPFATGSAECCVCPVCRAITAVRDPDPEFAERLATGAGDLAAGVASLLRAFSGPPTRPADPPEPTASPGDGAPGPAAGHAPQGEVPDLTAPQPADVWREATRSGHDGASSPGSPGPAGTDPGTAAATGDAVSPATPVADGEPKPAHGGTPPAVPASREPSEAPTARVADGD